MSAIEAHATLPDDAHKDLRCCKQCKLVKTAQQFEDEGCDNCAWEGNESPDHVTAQFSGMVAVIDPKKSWAAKWLHVGRMLPGVYALAVANEQEFAGEEEDMDEGYEVEVPEEGEGDLEEELEG